MPYIFVTGYYPTHIRDEVIKKWVEQRRKFPEDPSLAEVIIDVANKLTKKGAKVVIIYKAKEGKLDEALTYISKAMYIYQDIEGFEYEVEVYGTAAEAMEIIGMKMPE